MIDQVIKYAKQQQKPSQWASFLSAFSSEFQTSLETQEMRQLLHRIGRRMATETDFPPCKTLCDVTSALNEIWQTSNWGFVDIRETAARVELRHYLAPLEEAFGAEALPWSAALLEGFYAEFFKSLGADKGLILRQHQSDNSHALSGQIEALEFHLEQANE